MVLHIGLTTNWLLATAHAPSAVHHAIPPQHALKAGSHRVVQSKRKALTFQVLHCTQPTELGGIAKVFCCSDVEYSFSGHILHTRHAHQFATRFATLALFSRC